MEEYWDIFLEEQQNRELERVLLVGVDTGEEQNFDNSMEELKQLAKACFMERLGRLPKDGIRAIKHFTLEPERYRKYGMLRRLWMRSLF